MSSIDLVPRIFIGWMLCLGLLAAIGCKGDASSNDDAGPEQTASNSNESDASSTEPSDSDEEENQDSANEDVNEESENHDTTPRNWSHFRGGSSALGRAGGQLGDEIELKWEYRLEKGGFLGAPLIVDGIVYAVDMDGQAVAVDLANGNEIWKVDLDAFVDASPAIVEDKLIVGDLDGNLFCLQTSDGSEVWKKTLETSYITSVNEYEGDIIAVGETGLMTRMSVETGAIVWEFTVEDRILSSPSIAGSQCFLTGCASKLYGIELGEPEIVSSRELVAPTGVTAAIEDDLAYFSVSGGTMMCVNWKTGDEIWAKFDPMGDQEGSSCPAISENRVVIGGGTTRNVVAYERETGVKKWSYTTRRMINGSPIVVGDACVIGGNDGRVYVLDLDSGDLRFEFEIGGSAAAAPAAVGSEFVVANDKGGIFCFQSQ